MKLETVENFRNRDQKDHKNFLKLEESKIYFRTGVEGRWRGSYKRERKYRQVNFSSCFTGNTTTTILTSS